MNKLWFAALAALVAAPGMAMHGTISTDRDSKTGDIKWQARTKSYYVSFKVKGKEANAEYPLADVTDLEIPKPAQLDKAIQMVQSGSGTAAITPLTKIVQDYKMLVWDKPAARWLIEAYVAAGQAAKGLSLAEEIIRDDKTAAYTGEVAPAYWHALMKCGKGERLEECLKKAVATGKRSASAAALVMRGDLILEGGDTPELQRKALTDSYLRVVLMYMDEECRSERASAMRKAADCFDKIGQASRAEQFRTQSKQL